MIDLEIALTKILADLGSSLTPRSVRTALTATNREIRADGRAHGGSGEEPFWDMLSDERTHVFAVFGTYTFDLYVFSSSDFPALIGKLNLLAMADVNELRELLVASYGINSPHVSIDRSNAEHWLES